jgi:hypothetical protein
MGWPRGRRRLHRETEFEDGLDISGDDGCDLLKATERRFKIALSSEEDGYRKTFNLGRDEFLFHSEGFGPDLSTPLWTACAGGHSLHCGRVV